MAQHIDEGDQHPQPQANSQPASPRPSGCRTGKTPHSFTGLTGVLMANGTVKPISEVKAGDQVLTAEPGKKEKEKHKVKEVIVTKTDRDYVDVVVKTDAGPKTIETTKHHQFYEIVRNSWTQAGDLKPGQELQDDKGEPARILDVTAYTAERTTYDLSVEGLHTYHVLAGQTPVLVHNCGPEARAAAQSAPADATMSAAARFRGTDMVSTGHSGHSSRPAYFEPEIDSALADGGQIAGRGADNCAEIRACNALIAEHGADFEDQVGRSLRLSDIEFLTVRSATGAPEAACLSCQSVLVRRGATDLSR
ncbi:hypothetical protein I3W98_24695 [Streptomyces cavourensis]|nr:hypothetical protein [Streptomyces cavourensis]